MCVASTLCFVDSLQNPFPNLRLTDWINFYLAETIKLWTKFFSDQVFVQVRARGDGKNEPQT